MVLRWRDALSLAATVAKRLLIAMNHSSPATIATSSVSARIGGLDGLRAVAVCLVLIYHLVPDVLPGGFLGVDLFFVISGFLITTLLIAERNRNGSISLLSFWRRRARRLLPALGLVLLISTSAALLVSKDLLVHIGAQIGGAALFVANWVYIGIGSDYFARDNPELFRNTWSLAIEEQFYLVLPLVLLAALRMRTRTTRTLFFALLALASAWWMASLFLDGADATRVYFGTDTHAFGLLAGVALACATQQRQPAGVEPQRQLKPVQQIALALVGIAALIGIGVLALVLAEASPESFLGGFQVATSLMLVVVWAATRQNSWFGFVLDVPPLRWIGERSYGLYLWHWPILLIVDAAAKDASWGASAIWLVPAIVASLTFALASLSYTFVEQPIRKHGLRASCRLAYGSFRSPGRGRIVTAAVLLTLLFTIPATVFAIATAPAATTSAAAIERGKAALESQQLTPPSGVAPRDSTSTNQTLSEPAGQPTPNGLLPGGSILETPSYVPPPPVPIESWEIMAIGDSVMLASYPELLESFPEIWVDADVSRGLQTGIDIIEQLAAQGSLRPVLVVGLGTNGPIDESELNELLRLADGRKIVLVNAYADRWWTAEVNQKLAAFAEQHRGVVVADWAGAIVSVPGGLAGDEVHPNPSGGVAYAQSVQQALDALIERNEQPKRLANS